MALGSEVKIISSLRKKTNNNTFEPMFLGPEQRYIGALRASSNNNLEEQLLIGPDRIVSTWEDNIGKYEQIDFTSQEDMDATGASLDGNALVLDLNSFCFVDKEGYVSTDNIYAIEQVNNNLDFATFGTTFLELLDYVGPTYSNHYILTKIKYKNSLDILERHLLQWRRENGTLVDVAEKVITEQAREGNKIKRKESITNYLI